MWREYTWLSGYGKLLVWLAVLVSCCVWCNGSSSSSRTSAVEGLRTQRSFEFKQGRQVYDVFYADIYDHLVLNALKNEYEIGAIVDVTHVSPSTSTVADLGCGTGHHVAALRPFAQHVVGVDVSEAMVAKARANYPEAQFRVGNVEDAHLFQPAALTHALALYFSAYYVRDKRLLFRNVRDWLAPGGYFVVHLVDEALFDPVLPPGNPLYVVSPQTYAKERILHTRIKFHEFQYTSHFEPGGTSSLFHEKMEFRDGRVRKHEQRLYIDSLSDIVRIAEQCDFELVQRIDLVKCAYEHQFLYVFRTPTR